MRKGAQKSSGAAVPEIIVSGSYSRKEGALFIGGGTRHLHSSRLGTRDPLYKATNEAIKKDSIPTYAWEKHPDAKPVVIDSNSARQKSLDFLLSNTATRGRRDMKEKVSSVYEELLTNAIFHAYRHQDGSPRYHRRQSVDLAPNEMVEVTFAENANGVYLSITDKGGSLKFETLSKCLERCYGASQHQIESKDSGAGLGLYMVYETVSHLKVVTTPGNQTTVSVWIAAGGGDQKTFSFNFFYKR